MSPMPGSRQHSVRPNSGELRLIDAELATIPMPERFAELAHPAQTRRRFVLSMAAAAGLPDLAALIGVGGHRAPQSLPDPFELVAPRAGVGIGVKFGDAIQKLSAAGALDRDKFRALTGEMPDWVGRVFAGPSIEPILFTRERAPYLVNLLWPIGLSNKMGFNRKSPIATVSIPSFASTGGWTLGRAPNGYLYFNAVDAVRLDHRQEAVALAVASSTFRPCCDNSTFFQDCNHGSALLGLIELAASQGKTAEAIYRIALTANSYWFPEEYAKTALYSQHFEGVSWNSAPAPLILGAAFSSLTGWRRNVEAPLRKAGLHLPGRSGVQQPVCGI
jgi:hypothetical protein